MNFYWIKTSRFIKNLFSNYIWEVSNTEKKIYLTFDDGPTPEITEWTLKILKKHNAKATFFCIGNNIESNPEIFHKIIKDGHAVGNHTFNHKNGWKTHGLDYLKDIASCQIQISNQQTSSSLFRPPYGKIKPSQSKKLRQLGYKIIMWDILSADFDTTISPEKCLKNVLENTTSGSIIVFHDSVKAFPNLEYTLPRALEYWEEKGYLFEKLN